MPGDGRWLWGSDFTYGDLYEAEELFRMGHRIRKNRMVFVHGKTGEILEPIPARDGRYFGMPIGMDGKLLLLYVDFPEGKIRASAYDPEGKELLDVLAIGLERVKDCYNLRLHTTPLMLTRQAENRFQIIWPEQADFPIDPRETFCLRDGDRLYFSRWIEDPDYREEVIIRKMGTGEIMDRFSGSLYDTVGEEIWILR